MQNRRVPTSTKGPKLIRGWNRTNNPLLYHGQWRFMVWQCLYFESRIQIHAGRMSPTIPSPAKLKLSDGILSQDTFYSSPSVCVQARSQSRF